MPRWDDPKCLWQTPSCLAFDEDEILFMPHRAAFRNGRLGSAKFATLPPREFGCSHQQEIIATFFLVLLKFWNVWARWLTSWSYLSLRPYFLDTMGTFIPFPYNMGTFIPFPRLFWTPDCPRGRREVLVHWQALSPAEASWEDASAFMGQYPSFMFADKHVSQVVGNVTVQQDSKGPSTKVYQRFTHGQYKQKD